MDEGLGYEPAEDYGYGDAAPEVSNKDDRTFDVPKEELITAKSTLTFFQKKFAFRSAKDDDEEEENWKRDRPAFRSITTPMSAIRPQPRSVAIPYGR
jgi:hypothetical protein